MLNAGCRRAGGAVGSAVENALRPLPLLEPWGCWDAVAKLAGEARGCLWQAADPPGGSGRQPPPLPQRRDRRGQPVRSRGLLELGPTVMETSRRHDEGPDLLARHKPEFALDHPPTSPNQNRRIADLKSLSQEQAGSGLNRPGPLAGHGSHRGCWPAAPPHPEKKKKKGQKKKREAAPFDEAAASRHRRAGGVDARFSRTWASVRAGARWLPEQYGRLDLT